MFTEGATVIRQDKEISRKISFGGNSFIWNMGTGSFILCGLLSQWKIFWLLPWAGRVMSRSEVTNQQRRNIENELEKGVFVM